MDLTPLHNTHVCSFQKFIFQFVCINKKNDIFTQNSRIMFGSETDWVRNSLLNLRYLIVVAMAGELAAALTQHKGDADNLLGLGQVAEDQAAHLSQAVAEGGFDVSVFMLSRREMKKIT